MNIKDFTKDPEWGVTIYKTPYIKNNKIISPGIIIFNKIFLFNNPKRKDKVNPTSFKKIIDLDSNIWIKGIYNSGSLRFIKKEKERWKKHHETTIEDWEKFDFAMPFRKKLTKKYAIPLSLCSFVNPEFFKEKKELKKQYDLCLVDDFDKRFPTQLTLAKAILLFRKRYKKDLNVYFLGPTRENSRPYFNKVKRFLESNNITHKISCVEQEQLVDEINRCRIHLILRKLHGSPRVATETASCSLPQIITEGLAEYTPSYFYNNMINNKNYRIGVSFKHDNIQDLCEKIKYTLDNQKKFNPREYILKEESSKISQKKLNNHFRCLFQSKGLSFIYKKDHIFDLGKRSGTSPKYFYNSNLKDIEKLTKKIKAELKNNKKN